MTTIPTITQHYTCRLTRDFFLKSSPEVARTLLGCLLFTKIGDLVAGGIIIEVEAYGGPTDEACHAFRGPTKRNQSMFCVGGHCYVYLIYGLHSCVNVVTGEEGRGEAVLIRAIYPTLGVDTMVARRGLQPRRGKSEIEKLAIGPGNVCRALAINRSLNGEFFPHSERIWIEGGITVPNEMIQQSKRIGISKSQELLWRFTVGVREIEAMFGGESERAMLGCGQKVSANNISIPQS